MTKRPARLKAAEYKEILNHFRLYLPAALRLNMGALVSHIQWLEEDRLSLERQIRELSNMKLFEKKETPKVFIDHSEVKMPLKERLKLMYDKGLVNSEEWERTLRWNKLTLEEALKLLDK